MRPIAPIRARPCSVRWRLRWRPCGLNSADSNAESRRADCSFVPAERSLWRKREIESGSALNDEDKLIIGRTNITCQEFWYGEVPQLAPEPLNNDERHVVDE